MSLVDILKGGKEPQLWSYIPNFWYICAWSDPLYVAWRCAYIYAYRPLAASNVFTPLFITERLSP